VHIYAGETQYFSGYKPGKYNLFFLLEDNRYIIIKNIIVKANGHTNYNLDSTVKIIQADEFSKRLDLSILLAFERRAFNYNAGTPDYILEVFNGKFLSPEYLKLPVSGTVNDESGLPVYGAKVQIKGTPISIRTDKEGKFKIKLPEKGTLLISSRDFRMREIPIINQSDFLKITLVSTAGGLEEVVVTAGGVTIKRREQGNQATMINAQQLTVSPSALDLGADSVSRLNSVRLVLRGNRSFLGNNMGLVIIDNVIVPKSVTAPSFGIQFRGYVTVPSTGVYSFFYTCDDGGVLRMANRLVVDNDGNHAPIEKSGQVALAKGAHPIEVDFIEGGGGYTLKLKYSLNGGEPMDIPNSWFSH
ncbi:MAG: hypothetical protein EOO39_02310, partial [Cytophagaceae bacterium]